VAAANGRCEQPGNARYSVTDANSPDDPSAILVDDDFAPNLTRVVVAIITGLDIDRRWRRGNYDAAEAETAKLMVVVVMVMMMVVVVVKLGQLHAGRRLLGARRVVGNQQRYGIRNRLQQFRIGLYGE
jgi:uncharacterized membrane protein